MPSKCKSVDLPAPEGPMMETNSPSLISALMRRKTKVLVGPCSKYFSTFRRTIIGELIDTLILLRLGHPAPLFSRGARTRDVVEKVFAHRSSKQASAFSCPTRDRIDAVDHFISPKSGPRSLLWDFFNNVTRACRVETRLDACL